MTRDYMMRGLRAQMSRRGIAAQKVPHGAAIVAIVACGIHPLHVTKVRASGARSGCPMCEMRIEDVCRSLSGSAPPQAPTPRDHRPRINQERTMIVGCTCGWETPPGTTDSDDAYSGHLALKMTKAR